MSVQSSTEPNWLYAHRSAMAFGAATILGFLLLIATTAYDGKHRTQLETVAERTAVGDRNVVVLPEKADKESAPLAIYQGKELRPEGKTELRDVRMVRVAEDDSGKYTLYRGRDKELKDSDGKKIGDAIFLKLGPDQYVKVGSGGSAK